MATQFVMRAFNTALNEHVYWYSLGSADLTGAQSGYSPLVLTGIVVDYTVTVPSTIGSGNFSILTLSGDVIGPNSSNIVTALQHNPVQSGTLTSTQDGYVLTWKNTDGYWEAKPGGGSPSGPAGGDLSGTYPDPIVVQARNGLITFDSSGNIFADGYIILDATNTIYPNIGQIRVSESGSGLNIIGSYSGTDTSTVMAIQNNNLYIGSDWNQASHEISNMYLTCFATIGLYSIEATQYMLYAQGGNQVLYIGGSNGTTGNFIFNYSTLNEPLLQTGTNITSLTIGTNKSGATLALQADAATTGITVSATGVQFNQISGGTGQFVAIDASGNLSAAVAGGSTDLGTLLSQNRVEHWAAGFNGYNAAGFLNCSLTGVSQITNLSEPTTSTPPSSPLNTTPRSIGYTVSANTFVGYFQGGDYNSAWLGNAAGLGGFHLWSRFGFDQPPSGASTIQFFCGLVNTRGFSLPVTSDFTTQTSVQCVGIGFTESITGTYTGQGNFQIISCDGSNTTVTDSGVAVVDGYMYEMQLQAAANASSVTWTIITFNTNTTTSSIITTHLPGNTTFLTWQCGIYPTVCSGVAYFSTIRYTLETYQ